MLGADAPELPLYFVDDHFVPYEGAKPVGKGWNTERRHAQRGRDDILSTDFHARAVCFASGEPTGLSQTLPGVLAQLRAVTGDHAKIMLGFDRGGSYPGVFRACRADAQPPTVRERAEAGNRRLHQRWTRLDARHKRPTVAAVAVARELAGWAWSLGTLGPAS